MYNITCPKKRARFSSHSIRVGACVQLHVAGKDKEFIKFRLGWRSGVFRLYLRNIPVLARQHVEAINVSIY